MVTKQEILNRIKTLYEASNSTVISNGGEFFFPQEAILREQASWGDEDGAANFDFTTAPVWILFNDGEIPFVPLSSAEDLVQYYLTESRFSDLDLDDEDDSEKFIQHLEGLKMTS
jgi:hypothetical protein